FEVVALSVKASMISPRNEVTNNSTRVKPLSEASIDRLSLENLRTCIINLYDEMSAVVRRAIRRFHAIGGLDGVRTPACRQRFVGSPRRRQRRRIFQTQFVEALLGERYRP